MRARGSRSSPGVRSRAVGGSVGQISRTAGPHPLSLGVAGDNLVQDIGVRRKARSPHCEPALMALEWVDQRCSAVSHSSGACAIGVRMQRELRSH